MKQKIDVIKFEKIIENNEKIEILNFKDDEKKNHSLKKKAFLLLKKTLKL